MRRGGVFAAAPHLFDDSCAAKTRRLETSLFQLNWLRMYGDAFTAGRSAAHGAGVAVGIRGKRSEMPQQPGCGRYSGGAS